MPAGSKTDLPLAKAEAISGRASGRTFKGGKNQHNSNFSQRREVREYVTETALQTPQSVEKEGLEALQALEQRESPAVRSAAHSEAAVPLQPVRSTVQQKSNLQPMEDPPLEQCCMMYVYSIAIQRKTGSMGIDDSDSRIMVTLKEQDYILQTEVIPLQLSVKLPRPCNYNYLNYTAGKNFDKTEMFACTCEKSDKSEKEDETDIMRLGLGLEPAPKGRKPCQNQGVKRKTSDSRGGVLWGKKGWDSSDFECIRTQHGIAHVCTGFEKQALLLLELNKTVTITRNNYRKFSSTFVPLMLSLEEHNLDNAISEENSSGCSNFTLLTLNGLFYLYIPISSGF
ncbi:hypothetical protein BTVI_73112 [Pitangus sulphuratus]|nr:hypothetical protein BTVI_73112 [Pitangus sulphuratus]